MPSALKERVGHWWPSIVMVGLKPLDGGPRRVFERRVWKWRPELLSRPIRVERARLRGRAPRFSITQRTPPLNADAT